MRKLILWTCLLMQVNVFAQSENYSKVKIWLLDKNINELPVHIDHASHKKGVWLISDLSASEVTAVREAGYSVDILIEDVQAYYLARQNDSNAKNWKSQTCSNDGFVIPTVQNYSSGSMGGFFTYQEMLNNLDSMLAKYPQLISARAPIDNFLSIEGRPIYWLRISNNPNIDDSSKPEIMYTALHHAREPASMQQLIYYMWYVLENYESNPEVAKIVNNVEMYFVPCINPDGYIYNELTDPNGGGMHRKNRRNVGSNNKGVDLNRNYSYQYGGPGTSSDPNSDTYKGTGPFSEPETQAMKWFVENHNFTIALNYHSYADALLFPWGYENSFTCPDHDLYTSLTDYLVRENGYDNYQSSLLYEAAGDSDDWAYGDESEKPKVYAMTPEIGGNNDGFWPAPQNILGICRENVFQNFAAANSLVDAYDLKDLSSTIIEDINFQLPLNFTRLGLQANTYTLSLSALNANVSGINNPQVLNLSFGEETLVTFSGVIDPSSVVNSSIDFVLTVSSGSYQRYDTINKLFGTTQTIFQSSDSDMQMWETVSDWGLDNDAYSPPNSIGDSPNSNYSNNENNSLISFPIDLTSAQLAYLEFYAKWDIEAGYDYAQVSASVDGGSSWTALCGNYTGLGNENQAENEPLYDGVQSTWVKESMSLNDFIGEIIQLRFHLVSDGFVRGDGFNFDDLKVLTIVAVNTSISSNFEENISLYPNPTGGELNIDWGGEIAGNLEIQNMLGQSIRSAFVSGQQLKLDVRDLSPGSYFIYFEDAEGRTWRKHFVVK